MLLLILPCFPSGVNLICGDAIDDDIEGFKDASLSTMSATARFFSGIVLLGVVVAFSFNAAPGSGGASLVSTEGEGVLLLLVAVIILI